MRHLPLLAVAIPAALLLAACGGTPPPPQTASTASSAQPATTQVSTPAKADTIKPLIGNWGLDPANCGDQVLKISAKRFEGPGSGCDISGFTDNGDGTYTAAMSCKADGQTSNERIQMRPIFAPTGEGIDLVYLDRKNLTTEVLRCNAK